MCMLTSDSLFSHFCLIFSFVLQMNSVTVQRCKTLLKRLDLDELTDYCNPFYSAYYTHLLSGAEVGYV